MKVYSFVLLFCFLQTLICDKEGINQKTLQEALDMSLPFIKSFHPSPFLLRGSKSITSMMSLTKLDSHNFQFNFDEYGLLHLKFVNIKGQLKGSSYIRTSKGIFGIKVVSSYTADLSNISWEETYAIESTKKSDGKYDIKFKSMTESSVSYNLFRLTMKNSSNEDEIKIKLEIKKLDFSQLKNHLKKISGLVLETLKNKLK